MQIEKEKWRIQVVHGKKKKQNKKTKRKKNKKQPVCELESQLEERSYVSGEFVGEDAG